MLRRTRKRHARRIITSLALRRNAVDIESLTLECRGAELRKPTHVRAGVHSREKPHEGEASLQAGDSIQGKLDVPHAGPGKRKSRAKLRLSCTLGYAPDEDHVERHGLLRADDIHNESLRPARASRYARLVMFGSRSPYSILLTAHITHTQPPSPRCPPRGAAGSRENPSERASRWLPCVAERGPAPDDGTALRVLRRLSVENAHSSRAQQQPSPSSRRVAGERQSYMLLAVGILVAVALPYLLQPRAAISGAASTTAAASAHRVADP